MITGLHDPAQQANNEGAYIPMEDVDAALRRIEDALHRHGFTLSLFRIIAEERERLGLPKEVKHANAV